VVKFFLNKILIPAWDRKAVRRLKKYRTPESLCFDKNVKYGERDTERYDVIYPKEAKDSKNKLPVVLVIHGGGFIQGEKEQNEPFACEIAKRGFVVFNVEYTSKIGEGGVLLQLQDCALAAKAIYANLENYPVDKNNISIVADSAGAYLSLYTALAHGSKRLREVFGLVDPDFTPSALGFVSGYMLFDAKFFVYPALQSAAMERGYRKKPYYKDMLVQNLEEVKDLPPTMLVTSRQDGLRFMSVKMAKFLAKKEVPHVLVDYPMSHPALWHIFPVNTPHYEKSQDALDNMTDFFKRKGCLKTVIGLTGGIATGKSYVSKYLHSLGAEVINTDVLAKEIVEENDEALKQIKELFSETFVDETLDRAKLRQLIFENEQKRKQLEAVLHPLIYQKTEEKIKDAKADIVVLEVPLLFEAGFDKLATVTVCAICNEALQEDRLICRDNTTEEFAQKIILSQMDTCKKAALCDFVIDTGLKESEWQASTKEWFTRIKYS